MMKKTKSLEKKITRRSRLVSSFLRGIFEDMIGKTTVQNVLYYLMVRFGNPAKNTDTYKNVFIYYFKHKDMYMTIHG
jgi:hypothetical protein